MDSTWSQSARKRLDDGRDDQPLDIGARRVMRAELAALVRIERLFQQRAEDRRLDLAPVMAAAAAQLADLLAGERQTVRS